MQDLDGKRAALYGRYSTDLQDDRSIEDQFAMLREYAARHGIKIVAEFSDREKTSATLHNRVGLWDMVAEALKNRFDLVLIESPSRLSRKTADLFRVKNTLEFRDIQIVTLQQGVIDDTQATIHGLVGNEFLKQLSTNTRRGQKGRAREGKVIANHAYGYKIVPGKPGEREIDEDKAAIIRRIFMEYAQGEPPRAIARRLREEGHPSPGRAGWNHKNILAGRNPWCGGGILANRIYLGEVTYGRTYKKFNPETGTRVNRRNSTDEPVTVEVPHLRIVSDELWAAVHRVADARVRSPNEPRRPWTKYTGLLAGLIRCPCGSHMVIAQRGRAKVSRVKCAAAHFRDACDHTKSYDLPRLEEAVREALVAHLTDETDLEAKLEVFLDQYKKRFASRQQEALRTRDDARTRLREIEAATHRLIAHIESGTMAENLIRSRLTELSIEKAGLEERQRLADAEVGALDLHPSAIAKYREAVGILQGDLTERDLTPAHRAAFRNLVESITVLPTPARKPYQFQINGRLSALLGIDLYPPVTAVEDMVRERGGPADSACHDDGKSASMARWCRPGTTPSCRPMAACGSWMIPNGSSGRSPP